MLVFCVFLTGIYINRFHKNILRGCSLWKVREKLNPIFTDLKNSSKLTFENINEGNITSVHVTMSQCCIYIVNRNIFFFLTMLSRNCDIMDLRRVGYIRLDVCEWFKLTMVEMCLGTHTHTHIDGVAAFPIPWCSSYWKGSFQVTLD